MIQRHVHVHAADIRMHLHTGHQGEEQRTGRLLVMILKDLLANAAFLGSFRQQFLIIEGNIQLLCQKLTHIPSAGAKLPTNGNHRVCLHTRFLLYQERHPAHAINFCMTIPVWLV